MTHTAGELAKHLGATLEGDARAEITGVASPDRARAGDLIYVDSPRHLEQAAKSAARCAIVPTGTKLGGKTTIEAKGAKIAFVKAAAWLHPKIVSKGMVHATAIVAPTARIAANVGVGPYVVIEEEVQIGSGTIVDAFCFLGRGSKIGEDCRLHPRVTLYAGARLANRVEIHSGVVIGGDGFGYVFAEGRYWKFPQVGDVEIGDDVEIGCNTTIDRGSLDTTEISAGVKIDNLVQVAHNVRIGEHSVIAAQTGISGSSTLGKNVVMGGQVGIADHCTVEDGAIVGAQGGVPTAKKIRHGQTVWGTPARPIDRYLEQLAYVARLPELAERVRKLEVEKQGR